jgi:hypothetical protein
MISKSHHPLELAKFAARLLMMLALCGLQGCLSPMALVHAVIEVWQDNHGHSIVKPFGCYANFFK